MATPFSEAEVESLLSMISTSRVDQGSTVDTIRSALRDCHPRADELIKKWAPDYEIQDDFCPIPGITVKTLAWLAREDSREKYMDLMKRYHEKTFKNM